MGKGALFAPCPPSSFDNINGGHGEGAFAHPTRASRLLQLIMLWIIRIPRDIAAIERRAVVRRQREAVLQPAWQIGIGNEDPAERDGVGMAG